MALLLKHSAIPDISVRSKSGSLPIHLSVSSVCVSRTRAYPHEDQMASLIFARLRQ